MGKVAERGKDRDGKRGDKVRESGVELERLMKGTQNITVGERKWKWRERERGTVGRKRGSEKTKSAEREGGRYTKPI